MYYRMDLSLEDFHAQNIKQSQDKQREGNTCIH